MFASPRAQVAEIRERVLINDPVTPREFAALLKADHFAFANFLIDNNIASVNNILRNLGYTDLPFTPDRNAVSAILDGIIKTGDTEKIKVITSAFQFNPNAGNYTSAPEVLAAIKDEFQR